MQVKVEQYSTAVCVARLQVPELHEAHEELIQTLLDNHDRVIVFLGISPVSPSTNNPLPFESRKSMLLERFPDVTVGFIKDVADDGVWSKRLDGLVRDLLTPNERAVLYGGRSSFLEHYEGKLPTRELEQDRWVSGTEIRESAARQLKADRSFRHGVIYAASNRFPTCYPTVDVALFNEAGDKILLGRKEHERKYRLIGGFADPSSLSYEDDAKREVREETGLAISTPEYIFSRRVPDWRYEKEPDCIKTLCFRATILFGAPTPNDDIAELKYFDVAGLEVPGTIEREIVDTHRELVAAVLEDHLKRSRPDQLKEN